MTSGDLNIGLREKMTDVFSLLMLIDLLEDIPLVLIESNRIIFPRLFYSSWFF